jgi:hypothetical protein
MDTIQQSSITQNTKVGILQNRAAAIFGDNIQQTIMRSIYFNFAIGSLRSICATGLERADVMSAEELERANSVWDTNPNFKDCPEIQVLKKQMVLPDWWDKVHLGEFDNFDELDLSAAIDIPDATVVARVGGDILCKPTKHTIRLAPQVHLHMRDGSASSVFTRLNHSFSPNLRATPFPREECIEFTALRKIHAGEPLTFDYTTTEDSVFATPFVDLSTGARVGFVAGGEGKAT